MSSSESEDSSSSESADESIPTFAATTRMTLSERFGKMAQWSADRSNMDNLKTMRITKDSAGGPLKVMIEEQGGVGGVAVVQQQLEPPPRRDYSPAPAGHFPEELALTAPSGLMSWDDVRVRYEYYKNRGYLRDLDLQVSGGGGEGLRIKLDIGRPILGVMSITLGVYKREGYIRICFHFYKALS